MTYPLTTREGTDHTGALTGWTPNDVAERGSPTRATSGYRVGLKKMAEPECGCPRFPYARKFVNHTLACLVARRGERSIDDYYGSSDTSRPIARNGGRFA